VGVSKMRSPVTVQGQYRANCRGNARGAIRTPRENPRTRRKVPRRQRAAGEVICSPGHSRVPVAQTFASGKAESGLTAGSRVARPSTSSGRRERSRTARRAPTGAQRWTRRFARQRASTGDLHPNAQSTRVGGPGVARDRTRVGARTSVLIQAKWSKVRLPPSTFAATRLRWTSRATRYGGQESRTLHVSHGVRPGLRRQVDAGSELQVGRVLDVQDTSRQIGL
jgi:hypothetical protein